MSGLLRLARTMLAAAVIVPAALFVAPAAHGAVPTAIPLVKGWEYSPDPGQEWRPVAVPHVFNPRPVENVFGGGVGWYRLTFEAPDTPGFGWALRFEQVRRVARVWFNNVEIGTHRDPYVPFTLPAKGIRRGAPNTLVLRVDNRKGKEPREGWWNWGGITRPVTLVPQGSVRLADLGLMPKLHCRDKDDCDAQVLFDGIVSNKGASRVRPRIAVRLAAPGSGEVTRRTLAVRALDPGETAHVRAAITVTGKPALWSPEHPRLYRATVETHAGQRASLQQVDRLNVGLRSVTVRDGALLLNGRPLELRGASIQEDEPGRGPALTGADMDRVIGHLKQLKANVTRAHYLLTDRLLDKLDAAGILVWSQAPIYHRDRLLETRAQRADALSTLRGTVLGARNHPSVITHSVANELSVVPDEVPGTREYLDRALGIVRGLDPTLPVSVDLLSYPGYPRQDAYARYDLLGVNSYFGWYPGKFDHPTGNLADLRPYLVNLRRQYPAAGLVLTEFGAEATMRGPVRQKETYAFQADYVRQVLHIVGDLPFMSGAIYWTLKEFAVKPDWDGGAKREVPRDGIHNKGLITYNGEPKPAWEVARADFADTPLFRPSGGPGSGLGPWDFTLLAAIAALILGLLLVDAWALAGILGLHSRERRRARFAGQPARVEAGP
jgi:beta-glucuronidase